MSGSPAVRSIPRLFTLIIATTWLLTGIGNHAWAGQMVDYHDGYRCRGRWVSLQRIDGEWLTTTGTAVRLIGDGAVVSVLSGHPALAGQTLIRRRQSAVRLNTARSPAAELQMLRNRFGRTAANAVMANPRTGLRQISRSQIIVRLAPGFKPADLPAPIRSIKPVCGTPDQFVLGLTPLTVEDELALVSRLDALPGVRWAEPDFLKEWRRSYQPSDPLFPNQWHLHNTGYTAFGRPYSPAEIDISAAEAWDRNMGATNIIVAVIDDGVQSDHPDLMANMANNTGEINGNNLDDDGNGYIDDVLGWDFISSSNQSNADPKLPADGHGTSVAGLIAGRADNGVGGCGVAPDCRLLPVKIFLGNSYAGDSAVANAIRYAAGLTAPNQWRGADVINMSFGGGSPSESMDSALTDAATRGRDGKGCVLVAASGNSASAYQYYSKTLDPGTYYFEWQYQKDWAISVDEDCCRLGIVLFPNGVIERFDNASAPYGWNLDQNNDAGWYVEDNPARAFSTGRYQLRTHVIGNNKTATVRSPTITLTQAGSIQFLYWVATEAGYDLLRFRVVQVGEATPAYEYINSGVTMRDPYVAYPANHPSVIAAGASAEFDYRSDFSQYGEDLDVVAPGGGGLLGITTTDRTGSYGYDASDYTSEFGGTSAAAPITSGTIALLLSRHPDLTAAQARTLLRRSADKVGRVGYSDGAPDCGGFNPYYGYGRINAGRLLWLARAHFAAGPNGQIATPDGQSTFFCDSGTVYSLAATPDMYFEFNHWDVAAPVNAAVFQPAATNTTVAIFDDVTITGTFKPLLAAMGTPLYWLAGFGLNVPSFNVGELTDNDVDGHAAWQEWLAGTDPLDHDSVLLVRDLQRLSDGRCVLTWSSVFNRTYDILTYETPAGASTSIVNGLSSTPPLNVYTTMPLSAATQFIRIRTAPP